MEILTSKGHNLPFDPFKSCTIPRPIGWLSTISKDGIPNLAPYSQWQNLTWDPPMVMFAANQSVLGNGRKDTVVNAESTGWFVWNMATWELREAVNLSSKALASDVDEFDFAHVEKAASLDAPVPRVAASPCHFECRYLQTIRLPASGEVPTVDLVVGRVERIHIDDNAITDEGKIDVVKIKPIARLGYFDFTVIDNLFEMRAPSASKAELAGLEGTSR